MAELIFNKLHERLSDIEDWKKEVDPVIKGLEKSIGELKLSVATKDDMRELRLAINDNNENFSAALQSVPARLAASSMLVALFGAIAMAVAAIAAFYK